MALKKKICEHLFSVDFVEDPKIGTGDTKMRRQTTELSVNHGKRENKWSRRASR